MRYKYIRNVKSKARSGVTEIMWPSKKSPLRKCNLRDFLTKVFQEHRANVTAAIYFISLRRTFQPVCFMY